MSFVVLVNVIAGTNQIVYAQEEKKEVTVPTVFSDSTEKSEIIQIDEINFPDPIFRQYIKSVVFLDPNKTSVTKAEIEKVLKITLPFEFEGNAINSIKSVKGIELFTNLDTFNVSDAGITKLDVSNNLKLTTLNVSNTGLAEIDISKNTMLTSLSVIGMKNLKKVDVSNNLALTSLSCSNAALEELDVSKNRLLEGLDVGYTNIKKLDLSNNQKIKRLFVPGTMMTEIDVTNNPELTGLFISESKIKKIDVSNNPKLLDLYLGDTAVSELDVSNNPSLANLICYRTNISKLDLSKNIGLIKFNCAGSPILSLDLSNNVNMGEGSILESEIAVAEVAIKNPSFNLQDLDSDVDGTKILNLKGAKCKLGDTIFTDYKLGEEISYEYNVGQGLTMKIRIKLYGENSWSTKLKIQDWTYNNVANTPIAKAVWGDTTYLYSDSATGNYTSNVPTTAGTWYVKASVNEVVNQYTGLQSNPVAFKIMPKDLTDITITSSDINNETDLTDLVVADNGVALTNGIDYVVTSSIKDTLTTVDITGKGNYQGTITKTYTTTIPSIKEDVSSTTDTPSQLTTDTPSQLATGDTSSIALASITLLISGSVASLVFFKRKGKYTHKL